MTAVTIRPTFKKDSRPNNGLEEAADAMQDDKTRLFRVVGTMKYAGASVSEEGEITPAAKFVTIEVIQADDVPAVDALIDKRRRERGLGNARDIPAAAQMAGQAEFDFDGPGDEAEGREGGSVTEPTETRLGPDGEHEVPPPSGEEIVAERDEAKAAGVPAAEFSAGEGGS
jgi:hypothetical protein